MTNSTCIEREGNGRRAIGQLSAPVERWDSIEGLRTEELLQDHPHACRLPKSGRAEEKGMSIIAFGPPSGTTPSVLVATLDIPFKILHNASSTQSAPLYFSLPKRTTHSPRKKYGIALSNTPGPWL
jgi:hypothetical protein